MIELDKIYNEDCTEGIKRIPDASIDCILTDPPYLYLKKQKLERPFNEQFLFSEFRRVLKPTGFVVLFGRGTSFYRWNTVLASLGFKFKEEIVWDKTQGTSPLMRMSRVHETISLHGMPKATINKCKVPYVEMKQYDIQSILADIKRLRTAFNNPSSFKAVEDYLSNNYFKYNMERTKKQNGYTISSPIMDQDTVATLVRAMDQGMIEKSIIKCLRESYNAIHPTQKPVRLLERLLALTTNPGSVVLDTFGGSFSTAIACINTNRKYIGFEIDFDYYQSGMKRINSHQSKLAI